MHPQGNCRHCNKFLPGSSIGSTGACGTYRRQEDGNQICGDGGSSVNVSVSICSRLPVNSMLAEASIFPRGKNAGICTIRMYTILGLYYTLIILALYLGPLVLYIDVCLLGPTRVDGAGFFFFFVVCVCVFVSVRVSMCAQKERKTLLRQVVCLCFIIGAYYFR